MSESLDEQSSSDRTVGPAEAQAFVAAILAPDASRLESAVANLRHGMSEGDVHEYRVALTALSANVGANASLLKKRQSLRLQSLLSLLNRHASKARALDVKYQQTLAWSLDADESTQAALSSTMALLDLKRQKARNEFSLVLSSGEFQEIHDEIKALVTLPAIKRRWAKRTAAEIEAEVWANRHKAIESFRSLLKVSRRKDSQRKLHSLRMSAKQVRYALDGFEGETDNRELARLTQACLGGLRDSQTLITWLQKRLEKRTTTKLERHAIAMLIDAEKLRIKRLERKFKDIRKSVS